MHDNVKAFDVHITGLVQGVGFRPFVYRLARELELTGDVSNQVDGVHVHLEGPHGAITAFIGRVASEAPPAAVVEQVETVRAQVRGTREFVIHHSGTASPDVTRVSPDLPVCRDCLRDMETQPRRLAYLFTNCTNCGPRFSIVRGLPYDRPLTTMAGFEMCADCKSEYSNVEDRRFHAQPVACSRCGPRYRFEQEGAEVEGGGTGAGTGVEAGPESIPELIAQRIDLGEIVALKGLGGYHLVCDALNGEAVQRLRTNKRREGKPLAVMVRDVETACEFARVSEPCRDLLESNARPIVILPLPIDDPGASARLPEVVTAGLRTVGVVLPYMPLHHLLFDHLRTRAVVLTSGNLSSEPIVRDNADAVRVLGPISDLVVTHNREIHNRLDDSVALVAGGRSRVLRRARGYVPTPVRMPLQVDGIVALGAEQKNTLCFGSGREAILSQHIGDVDDPETIDFLHEVLERFPSLFRVSPRLVAVDRHPDYASGHAGRELGLPVVEVWHHHAHIASCMAEHGITEPVIGVALDGTGYGTDRTIWGGEFMIADLAEATRFLSFKPVPLPGGDLVADHPWRTAISYLVSAYEGEIPDRVVSALPVFTTTSISGAERESVLHALSRSINTPLSSGAGRLFDAVSALCGLCLHASFDAEAPVRLTDIVDPSVHDSYPYVIVTDEEPARIDFGDAVRGIAEDMASAKPIGLISTMFHNTISDAVARAAGMGRDLSGLARVVLTGGVFQNWFLLETVERKLTREGFDVYSHSAVPSNDGGISLGQLAIAARTSL